MLREPAVTSRLMERERGLLGSKAQGRVQRREGETERERERESQIEGRGTGRTYVMSVLLESAFNIQGQVGPLIL